MLIPFGSTIGIYLLITHMGTVISIKQLVSQWKTIVVCLAGLAGMCALCLVILPGIIGRSASADRRHHRCHHHEDSCGG